MGKPTKHNTSYFVKVKVRRILSRNRLKSITSNRDNDYVIYLRLKYDFEHEQLSKKKLDLYLKLKEKFKNGR